MQATSSNLSHSSEDFIDDLEDDYARFSQHVVMSKELPFHAATPFFNPVSWNAEQRPMSALFASNFVTNQYLMTVRKALSTRPNRDVHLRLDLFLSMPIELIHEVLGHLHPIDLYHLTMTARALRQLLLSKSSAILWIKAFESRRDLPTAPQNIFIPRWAALLFGPAKCDECDACGVHLDFALLRRLCPECRPNELLSEEFPAIGGILPETWSLVPRTYRLFAGQYYQHEGPSRMSGQCYKADILGTNAIVRQYYEAIRQEVPGSREALEEFKVMRRIKAAAATEDGLRLSRWAWDVRHSLEQEAERKANRNHNMIIDRLAALGHDLVDITIRPGYFNLHKDVTHRDWKRMLPLLISWALKNKADREEMERVALLARRRVTIRRLYSRHKQNIEAQRGIRLPPDYEVLLSEPFQVLVNQPGRDNIQMEQFRKAMDQLPSDVILKWTESKMQDLLHALRSQLSIQDDSVMDLATAVLSCPSCRENYHTSRRTDVCRPGLCLIGKEDMLAHLGCPHLLTHKRLALHPFGSRTAANLLELLGLDPRSSTQAVDDLDPRLICTACPVQGDDSHQEGNTVWGYKALTWRESVMHAIAMELQSSHTSCLDWVLLSATQTAKVRREERRHPAPASVDSWSCGHCVSHFQNFVSRAQAFEHVQNAHHPLQLVSRSELIRYPNDYHFFRRTIIVSVEGHIL